MISKVGTHVIHVKHVSSGFEVQASPFNIKVYKSQEQLQAEAQEAKKTRIAEDREAKKKRIGIGVGVLVAVLIIAMLVVVHLKRVAGIRIADLESQKHVADRRVSVQQRAIHGLESSLKKKNHSQRELELMAAAMESLSKTSSDELRGVLVPSADVKILSMLGKGAFGVVNLGEYKGKQVAVKQLITIDEESIGRFRFECFLMKNLRHPYIVELVGVCWDDKMLACLLEFISNGSLQDHLKKDWSRAKGDKLTWASCLLKIALECAMGVQYLHHARYFDEKQDCWKDCIIHRDLKPDNILVTPTFTAKLSDFGEARATELNLAMTTVGTPIFIAPEVLRNDMYDSKVDVYSFGICLIALLRCEQDIVKFFFEGLRKHMKKKNSNGIGITILNNRMMNTNFRPALPQQLYPSLKELIEECWKNDPNERPSFDGIVLRLGGAITLEVNRMQEPDVSSAGDAEEGGKALEEAADDNYFGRFGSTRFVDAAPTLETEVVELRLQVLAFKKKEEELEEALSLSEMKTRHEKLKVGELEEALSTYRQQESVRNNITVGAPQGGQEQQQPKGNGTDEQLAVTTRVA